MDGDKKGWKYVKEGMRHRGHVEKIWHLYICFPRRRGERETVSDTIFEELMAHNFQKINEKHLTTNSRNFTNPKGDK